MTANGWLQIILFFVVILAITKPLGVYMYRVFEGPNRPLPRVLGAFERLLLKLCGVREDETQNWKGYAVYLLAFSAFGVLVTYALQRLQQVLPLNPQHFGAVSTHSSFNTAVSFTTNTNWQGYAGESTMSYLTQMAGLAWHNFTSAGAGICVALVLARGLTRRREERAGDGVGHFVVDLVRSIVYVLLPISIVFGLVLAANGVIQNLSPYVEVTTLEGAKQTLAMGPVASQEIIKELGTNGGGFFNANSAHPFENPTPLTNFIELLLIFAIPAALTYTFGRMAKSQRQGWAIFGAMAFLFFVGVAVAYGAESTANTALAGFPVDQSIGNMEGKEVRFGVANSALWAVVTTNTSCGAVNAMHDSFNAIGGLVPLTNIMLGEVIFGGTGSGLYGMLVMVLLSVFIAGLMVGRTPEYLGKKVEAREIKAAMLYVLIFPLIILGFSAWAAVAGYGTSSLNNAGPHGLSEILYAFTSGAGNNGSAFAGLNANTPFYNTTLGLTMLAGRFLMIVPVMAIAGSMLGKKTVAPGPGTFPTNGALFSALVVGVILIVGALTFFPALSLGPIAEHFVAARGKDVLTWTRNDRSWNRRAPRDAATAAGPRGRRRGPLRGGPYRARAAGVPVRSRHHQARDQGQLRQAVAAAGRQEPGDVRGRDRQRADHAAVLPRSVRGGCARGAAVVHGRHLVLAVVHGRVRELRGGGRRGTRQGAGRFAAPDAHADQRAPADRRHGGGGERDRAARGRPRGRRGGRADPGRRRDRSRAWRRSTNRRSRASRRRSSARAAATARRSPAAPRCCRTRSSSASPRTRARPSSTG